MLKALQLALTDLTDRQILIVLVKSIAVTLAIFALIGAGLWFAVDYFVSDWLGSSDGWIAATIAVAAVLVTVLTGWFLFRVISVTVLWFFADDVVDLVERKHYPAAAETGKMPGYKQSLILASHSLLRVIGYNAAALPFYVILLFTGIGAPIIFLIVNALLLGRDLEEMLGARHDRAADMQSAGNKHLISRGPRWLLGLIGTAGLMVPIVNFLVPVIATSMATHLLHRRKELAGN